MPDKRKEYKSASVIPGYKVAAGLLVGKDKAVQGETYAWTMHVTIHSLVYRKSTVIQNANGKGMAEVKVVGGFHISFYSDGEKYAQLTWNWKSGTNSYQFVSKESWGKDKESWANDKDKLLQEAGKLAKKASGGCGYGTCSL